MTLVRLDSKYFLKNRPEVSKNKYEFQNQRHKPTLLATPHFLPRNWVKFAINRILVAIVAIVG